MVKLLDGVAALRAKMARINKALDQFERISSRITVVNASGDAAFSDEQVLLTSQRALPSSVETTISDIPIALSLSLSVETAILSSKAGNIVAVSTPIVSNVIDMLSKRLYDVLHETAKLADDARQKTLHDHARELTAASFAYEPEKEGGVELPPWLFADLRCDFPGSEQARAVELKRVSHCADRPPRVLAKSPVIITRSQQRNRASEEDGSPSARSEEDGSPRVLERRRGMCYLMWQGLEDTGGGGQVGICPEYDITLPGAIEVLVYLECGDGDSSGGTAENGVWATCDTVGAEIDNFFALQPHRGRHQRFRPATEQTEEDGDVVREGHAGACSSSLFLFLYYGLDDGELKMSEDVLQQFDITLHWDRTKIKSHDWDCKRNRWSSKVYVGRETILLSGAVLPFSELSLSFYLKRNCICLGSLCLMSSGYLMSSFGIGSGSGRTFFHSRY